MSALLSPFRTGGARMIDLPDQASNDAGDKASESSSWSFTSVDALEKDKPSTGSSTPSRRGEGGSAGTGDCGIGTGTKVGGALAQAGGAGSLFGDQADVGVVDVTTTGCRTGGGNGYMPWIGYGLGDAVRCAELVVGVAGLHGRPVGDVGGMNVDVFA